MGPSVEALNAESGPQTQARLNQFGRAGWVAITNVVGAEPGQMLVLFKRRRLSQGSVSKGDAAKKAYGKNGTVRSPT